MRSAAEEKVCAGSKEVQERLALPDGKRNTAIHCPASGFVTLLAPPFPKPGHTSTQDNFQLPRDPKRRGAI